MHPAFATIEYGPFASAYHRAAVNDDFKSALSAFLESQLLPQVEEPFESTSGKVTAEFDDDKFCGAQSLVRDRYRLQFVLHRPTSDDTAKVTLEFDPTLQAFKCSKGFGLCLVTERRRREQDAKVRRIRSLCHRIVRRELASAQCPECSIDLTITDLPDLFDVRCPSRCFNFNFHREPATGEFLHGHFYC